MFHRIHRHIKTHHKKYLFGIIRGGLFFKLAVFVITGLGISISLGTRADVQSGCYTTGQYLTGGYQTGGYYTGEYSTGATLTGGYLTGGYSTGGYMTGGYQTGCYRTGEYFTGEYLTGGYLTGGYFSGEEWTGEYSTGEYLTGGYFTGGYETGCTLTGEYFTGEYFTGEYLAGQESTGQYLTGGYWTGYYMTGQYLTGGYITGCIAIPLDIQKPSITGIVVTLNGVTNNYISLGGISKISFMADEALTGNVVLFRGVSSALLSQSGLQYTYQQTLSTGNTEGSLSFSIAYNDLAGNTGFYSATGPVIFDKTAPIVTGLTLSGDDQNGFILSRQTSENARYILNYTISGFSGNISTGTVYGTSFMYLITGITIGNTCDFQLSVLDYIGNTTQLSGKIEVGTNGIVSFNYVSLGSTAASVDTGSVYSNDQSATGNLANFAITLQNEINKYNSCRDGVSYRELDLTIQGNAFSLHMPIFEKDTVKQLVQAFTVFMVSTLKKDTNLTPDDFVLLTKKFNNILIILKLVRDNDNECKQNLSNYHILQFQRAMDEYGINL